MRTRRCLLDVSTESSPTHLKLNLSEAELYSSLKVLLSPGSPSRGMALLAAWPSVSEAWVTLCPQFSVPWQCSTVDSWSVARRPSPLPSVLLSSCCSQTGPQEKLPGSTATPCGASPLPTRACSSKQLSAGVVLQLKSPAGSLAAGGGSRQGHDNRVLCKLHAPFRPASFLPLVPPFRLSSVAGSPWLLCSPDGSGHKAKDSHIPQRTLAASQPSPPRSF